MLYDLVSIALEVWLDFISVRESGSPTLHRPLRYKCMFISHTKCSTHWLSKPRLGGFSFCKVFILLENIQTRWSKTWIFSLSRAKVNRVCKKNLNVYPPKDWVRSTWSGFFSVTFFTNKICMKTKDTTFAVLCWTEGSGPSS